MVVEAVDGGLACISAPAFSGRFIFATRSRARVSGGKRQSSRIEHAIPVVVLELMAIDLEHRQTAHAQNRVLGSGGGKYPGAQQPHRHSSPPRAAQLA